MAEEASASQEGLVPTLTPQTRMRKACIVLVNRDAAAAERLARSLEDFDQVTGGPEETGWPLGRDVYRSELYELVEGIEGIDHVDKILLNDGEVAFIGLDENQLPQTTIGIAKK